ncbi:DUF4192 domain-containing protein [Streptomyces scabiei]|uniref:DUF4192 domain-containing protein n=1 Tax=Streptomyces scabiei TaxID=1930 RepID=UPI0029A84766|nr:DUF4192 family protein [Streptomyces scabiei]MDX2993948.1 DUF4192 family protein [Streptomyces scabiei]
MTNHSEAAGTSGNSDISGQNGCGGSHESPVHPGHGTAAASRGEPQVTLRTPAELADALPYLLGYRPEDSIVLVALHDRDTRGRFGGRARLGIPAQTDDWPSVAHQLARGLVTGSERRGAKPESMVAFLCQDPASGESARDVMERLRPLAQLLRRACGSMDVPVVEALCISDGRFWSYCCPGNGCCAAGGEPMGLPGTSVLAAAATYAGLQVRGSLRELRARLMPWETAAALQQEAALDSAQSALIPRILDVDSRTEVADETLAVARRVIGRLADVPPGPATLDADLRDDALVGHDDAATLILGLQDRATRDRAAEWMEGDEAGPALRLWRALARRCVGPYGEHAAAPLTLVGWVAWSSGDELEAREALAMALAADPEYLFARLLHQACNDGLDPETIRRCLRAERRGRDLAAAPVGGACAAGGHGHAAAPEGSPRRASRERTDPVAPTLARAVPVQPSPPCAVPDPGVPFPPRAVLDPGVPESGARPPGSCEPSPESRRECLPLALAARGHPVRYRRPPGCVAPAVGPHRARAPARCAPSVPQGCDGVPTARAPPASSTTAARRSGAAQVRRPSRSGSVRTAARGAGSEGFSRQGP